MKRFHNTARQKLSPPVIHHAQPSGRSTDLIGNAWLHAGVFSKPPTFIRPSLNEASQRDKPCSWVGSTCLATSFHLENIKHNIVLKSLMSVALKPRRECISIHASTHSWQGNKIFIFSMEKRFILSCILGKKKSGKYTPLTIQYTNGT